MNALWKHLQEMAKAQLFSGGYLGGQAIRPEQPTPDQVPRPRTLRHNEGLPSLKTATCP